PQSCDSLRMPRTYACILAPSRSDRGGYFTDSASSISFLPFGTSLANSVYELFWATLTHSSYSCDESVTTSTLCSLKTLTISSSRLFALDAKKSCDFLPACISTPCCFLFRRLKVFLDINTGSYMNQSALSPGAVRHFTCS